MVRKIICIAFTAVFMLLVFTRLIWALDFGTAYIRFDRMQTSAFVSALVCAKPSSSAAGIEAQAQIIFPSDFTISSTISNWTTSTVNLPGGTSAWPFIGATAVSVSGQTVTFSGGDLISSSTTYCFYVTGASSTTSPTTGNKTGYIRSLASDNSVINSTQFGVVLVAADNVQVTATVPANSTDFQATLTQITPGTTFNQDEEIQFQITYGSTLSTPTNITVEAAWTEGTISGDINPSLNILNYVVGSATNAYGGASPVIDTVNRKIDWVIPVFPGNTTGQTVNFTLKTTSSYTNTTPVTFTVLGRVLGPSTQTADSSITDTYIYNPPPTPSPSTTPTPTSTPAVAPTSVSTNPSVTSTPTSTSTPPVTTSPSVIQSGPFIITSVDITSILSDSASLQVVTSAESTVDVRYGAAIDSMNEIVRDGDLYNQHLIQLRNLKSNTRYYFTVTAKNRVGKQVSSDAFTFITALTAERPSYLSSSLVVTSQKVLIYSSSLFQTPDGTVPVFSLPNNIPYEINFKFKGGNLLNRAQMHVRNSSVLGIQSDESSVFLNSDSVAMTELSRDIFSGRLRTQQPLGYYGIYVKVQDINGNIFEEHVADVKVIDPIIITQVNKKTPLEHAKVVVFVYNPTIHAYEAISSVSVPVPNPAYSDINGEVPIVLPHGDYKVNVSATGYVSKTVPFVLGAEKGREFPRIYLEREPFSITTTGKYFLEIMVDALSAVVSFMFVLANSERFFELVSLFITFSLVYIVCVVFSSYLRVPIHSLWHSILHHWAIHPIVGKKTEKVTGVIIEKDTQNCVGGAEVFLLNRGRKILAHTVSDTKGKFSFAVHTNFSNYQIQIMKEGYVPEVFDIGENAGASFSVSKSDQGFSSILSVKHYVHDITAVGFEVCLGIALLFEVVMGSVLGWVKTFAFIAASVIALIVWFLHIERE